MFYRYIKQHLMNSKTTTISLHKYTFFRHFIWANFLTTHKYRVRKAYSLSTFAPLYCKDTIPKIRNKYFRKRNCEANFYSLVSVRDLYIPTINLPILCNSINAHRHMHVEIGTEAAQVSQNV
jgi:hypothetical protein